MRRTFILAALAAVIAAPSAAMAQDQQTVSRATTEVRDRITVEVEGSGPDVILIPGLASSRTVWSDLANRLRGNYRLHLVQIAGFAGSPSPDTSDGKVAAPAAEAIADYILRERLQSPTVIGHSLGGEVGLMLAARHEGLVGRLMVVDALPFYSLLMNPNATVDSVTPQAKAFRDALLSAPNEQADAMQAAAIARLVKTEDARASVIEAGLASDRTTVANATYELMTTDLRNELDRISIPVEVVYAYDPMYGVPAERIDSTFRSAYARADTAHFTRIDDSFHFVTLDQPEEFAQTVRAFLVAEE